jgi:hypothetical protein
MIRHFNRNGVCPKMIEVWSYVVDMNQNGVGESFPFQPPDVDLQPPEPDDDDDVLPGDPGSEPEPEGESSEDEKDDESEGDDYDDDSGDDAPPPDMGPHDEDDEDDGDEGDEGHELGNQAAAVNRFVAIVYHIAKVILDLKVQFLCSNALLDAVCKMQIQNFQLVGLHNFAELLPASYRQVLAIVGVKDTDQVTKIDVCGKCQNHLYWKPDGIDESKRCPYEDKDGKVCDEPRCDAQGNPKQWILQFSIGECVRRWWAQPAIARALKYPSRRKKRPGWNTDVQDGKIWTELFIPKYGDSPHNTAWGFTNDPTELGESNKSVTPIIGRCLSLSKRIRNATGMMPLFAIFPIGFKNFVLGLQPTFHEFLTLQTTGILVYDADLQQEVTAKMWLHSTINDLRAMPYLNRNMQQPAKRGACCYCDVRGVPCGGTQCYNGHVRRMARGHDHRVAHKREFQDDVAEKYHDMGRPPRNTKAKVHRRGLQAEQKGEAFEGQHERGAISRILPDYDCTCQNWYCNGHCSGNVVKLMMVLLGGTVVRKKSEWSTKRKDAEVPARLAKLYPARPYRAEKPKAKAADVLFSLLKLWSSAGRLKMPFKHLNHFNIHDKAMLCGPIGAYLVSQLGLEAKYEELFIDIFFILDTVWHKHMKKSDRKFIDAEMNEVFTRAERLLPKFWNTIALHYLAAHTFSANGAVANLGIPSEVNMLDSERFNVVITKLMKSRKNAITGLKNQYLLMSEVQKNRLDTEAKYEMPYATNASSACALLTTDEPAWEKPGNQIRYGKQGQRSLDIGTDGDPIYDNLLRFYSKKSPSFRGLLSKYKRHVRPAARKRTPLYSWVPPQNLELDDIERRMLRMDRVVVDHPRMFVDDQQFRAPRANRNLKSDDGGIVVTYKAPGSQRATDGYGTIQGIYEHILYVGADGKPGVGSPSMTLLKVEWKETVMTADAAGNMVPKMMWSGRTPVVQSNANAEWNRQLPYMDAVHMKPYNVVFWEKKPDIEEDRDLVVISRNPGRSFNKKIY